MSLVQRNCNPISRSIVTRSSLARHAQILTRGKKTVVSDAAKESLSWTDYLAIRKGKRRWEQALTIPCVAGGLAGGAMFFGSLEMDASKPFMGIDPIFVLGGGTLGCMGLGYLLGPIIGSTFWRLTHRRSMALIEARDREFHKRIVKMRADPTAQSYTNPVPDFYGEKIGSLHQYRQWLKDQAKYKRKSQWTEEQL
ncbi:mitochondrial import protein Pam17 [Auriscalpium vulgare]|uniref:Mitochondrial import protein Pam17 n=1 Tax=Auriscalpium vulgare TaxID=40419 RepID=A0ACB8RJS3_9AGAM|nr:mitochondrial import protein Pam17 [Auriscalpium vulgare]